MTRPTWEQYALMIAKVVAARSEDPYQQVGACILRKDYSVASVGYNGAPPKIEIDWSNRDERRARVIHAEANAFRYLKPQEGFLLATTLLPCRNCIQLAASYGIEKIVRDLRVHQILEGTNEIMRMIISRHMLAAR